VIPLELTQNEVKRMILQDRDMCQKFRTPQEELTTQGYKQYLGWRPKVDNKRSNLHIPVSYRIVDTIRSREVKAIAGSRPFVEPVVKPGPNTKPELMTVNEEKAKIAGALLDQQLITNKFVPLVYDWATSKLIFPYTVVGVCWKYQEETVKKRVQFEALGMQFPGLVTQSKKEVLYDDNEIFYVDMMDYWYDPYAGSQDIGNHRFGIYREWLTKDQIEQRLEFYKKQGNGKVFMPTNEEWKAIQGCNVTDNRFQRFSETDQAVPDKNNNETGYNDKSGINKNQRYAVYNYWTPNNLHLMVNDTFVPLIGDNPFWRHKQIPFAMQSFERMPGEVVGRSALHFIYHLQEEVNTQRNQRIDNVSLILNVMWKVRKGTVDKQQLISRPGGIIELEDMGDIEPASVPDFTGSSIREDSITIKEMEDTLGSPAITQGIESAGDQTATEITSQNSNASVRIDVKLMLWTEPWERVLGLMDMNNQQLITNERLVQMFDEQGLQYWKQMGPLDVIGYERDYVLAGAKIDPSSNKELRRQQKFQLLVEGPKVGLKLDYDKLAVDYLKDLDVPNASKYYLPPEQIQAQEQAAMQQQMDQQNQMMEQKQMENQQKMQQEIVKIVLQTIGKVVENNPALLTQLNELMPTQGGDPQLPMNNAPP
jgi:hypothetical protein